jgi:short-subunit dehydrogenase
LVLSSRKEAELGEMVSALPGDGHRAVVADLADDGAAAKLFAGAGEFQILVANAGLPGGGAVEAANEAAISNVIRVNLEAPIVISALAAARMRERGSGQIVLISSLAGKLIPAGAALYSASKSGLRAFGLGLRNDLAGSGVGVSVIYPGFVRDAGMFHDGGGKAPPGIGTATPEQVGAAVARAIEQDRAQVDVAPLQQRGFANLGIHMPRVMQRLERALGAGALDEERAPTRGGDETEK